MFSFIDWLSFGEGGWGGGRLKLDVQGQGGRIILNVARARGGGDLENLTIFVDVRCVSSLLRLTDFRVNTSFLAKIRTVNGIL